MHWRLHAAIFSNRLDEAIEILSEFNDTIDIIRGVDINQYAITNVTHTAVLGLTTIQDTKNVHGVPGLYYHTHNYRVSFWLPRLSQHLPILNKSAIFLPSGLLLAVDTKLLLTLSNDNKVFIRPDSGNKLFTGRSICINNWDYNVLHLVQKIEPSELIVLASHVQISPIEWRFWIVSNQVVTHSPYSIDNSTILPYCVPDCVLALAIQVAEYHWQLDYAYVLDIVLDEYNNPFINEVNATSTSGIYQAQLKPLLCELRSLAIRNHSEYVTSI